MFEVINTPICSEKLRFVEFVFGIANFRGFAGETRQSLRDLNACNIACYISFDVFFHVLPDYDSSKILELRQDLGANLHFAVFDRGVFVSQFQ